MIQLEYRKKPLPLDKALNGTTLLLTGSVIDSINCLLPRRVERDLHENVLYIAGVIEPTRRIGLFVIAPKAETGRGYYHTDRASHAEVLNVLDEHDLAIVAQVHCHPGELVYHSEADDDLAFVRVEGHWSIVVPHYGLKGMFPLDRCGFHRFQNGTFALLTKEAVAKRIKVIAPSIRLTEV